jgi:uncharacterized membrane protein
MHLGQKAEAKRTLYRTLKAKADAEKKFPIKLADQLTESFGTLSFLLLNILAFAIWIIVNADILPGIEPFDPFPFGFLTMVVSLEAIVLAIVILISQNRGAKIGDLREEVDLQIDVKSEAEITKLLEMLAKLLKKNDIDLSGDHVLQEMLIPVDVDKLEEALEEEVEGKISKLSE